MSEDKIIEVTIPKEKPSDEVMAWLYAHMFTPEYVESVYERGLAVNELMQNLKHQGITWKNYPKHLLDDLIKRYGKVTTAEDLQTADIVKDIRRQILSARSYHNVSKKNMVILMDHPTITLLSDLPRDGDYFDIVDDSFMGVKVVPIRSDKPTYKLYFNFEHRED